MTIAIAIATATTPVKQPVVLFMRRPLTTLALTCAAMVLGGCAALAPSTPEQVVQKRSTEYWEARMAGNYEKAYALSAPSYRKLRTEPQFRMQFGSGAGIERAEVNKVECEAERCRVQLKVGVTLALPGINLNTVDTYINEIWLLEEGQWWHYQEM